MTYTVTFDSQGGSAVAEYWVPGTPLINLNIFEECLGEA